MSAFLGLLYRDIILALRSGGATTLGLIFSLMLLSLMPFALGPDQQTLGRIAPALLWLTNVLSLLLGLDRLFQSDEEDGSLALMRTSRLPMEAVILAKILAYWLTCALPLIIATPLLGMLIALPIHHVGYLMLGLLAGTPALTAIGAVGAALTASLRRGGLLLPVLVLPLMIPVLIFGVSTVQEQTTFIPALTPLLILCALSLFASVAAVVGGAAALRGEE